MPGAVIRAIGPEALAAVAEVASAALPGAWSEGQLASELARASPLKLAIFEGGRMLGFALFRAVLDEAELLLLAVREDARRRGHAGALWSAAALELARAGVREVFLEVREGNTPALALYERLGFARVGRRPGYYADTREAALVLRIRLSTDAGARAPG